MRLRVWGINVAVVVFLLIFSGCGSEKQQQPKPEQKATIEREKGPEMAVDTIVTEPVAGKATAKEAASLEETGQREGGQKQAESQSAPKKPKAPLGSPQNPLVGEVVDLAQVLTGGSGKVNRQQAQQLVERGQPIGILAGNKLYLVYHPDGSYAGKKLARFAGAPVGIIGQIRSRGGWNVIIADMIESVR